MMTIETAAHSIMERCDILGTYSEENQCLTRRFATPAMRKVNDLVGSWMQAAGMVVKVDQVGNLIGRYEGIENAQRTLLLGSHLDTVRDAGKYDGILGVLLALVLVERLHERAERLPFALEVIGFADEEGTRYHTPYIGSEALAGIFDERALKLVDEDGITLANALRAFGGDPEHIAAACRRQDDLLGYCEVHIEQGPILEASNLPVGVVSAITGQSRVQIIFTGQAGHAGTVPMAARHDALCATASFVLEAESRARAVSQMVATVGKLIVQPGASNVIPGSVTLSLDLRHPDDHIREHVCQQLYAQAQGIGEKRGVTVTWKEYPANPTVRCSEQLTQLLAQAITRENYPVRTIPSGAGHDAAVMAELTTIAMLFVRCRGGISHHPDEAVEVEDVAVALRVMEDFLGQLAQNA